MAAGGDVVDARRGGVDGGAAAAHRALLSRKCPSRPCMQPRQGVVMRIRGAMVNRTQRLVLGFVVLAWLALVVILLVSPDIYDRSLRLGGAHRQMVDLGFLVVLSGLLALLGLSVVR